MCVLPRLGAVVLVRRVNRGVCSVQTEMGRNRVSIKQRVEHPGGKPKSCSLALGDPFHNGRINEFGSGSLEE